MVQMDYGAVLPPSQMVFLRITLILIPITYGFNKSEKLLSVSLQIKGHGMVGSGELLTKCFKTNSYH